MRQVKFKLIVVAVVLFVCALLFPRAHKIFGPRLFCATTEVNTNSGQVRETKFVLFLPLSRVTRETSLSIEARRLGVAQEPGSWLEGSVKAGLGDYYPRPEGGKILKEVSEASRVIAALSSDPRLPQTVSNIMMALRQRDATRIDTYVRAILE